MRDKPQPITETPSCGALAIGRILAPHVVRVAVASTRELHAISDAKAKIAGQAAGRRHVGGHLAARRGRPRPVPPAGARAQLVRQATRTKTQIHAVLYRNLQGAGTVSDLFAAAGRRWLAGLQLPADERETLESCLRQLDFLGGEGREAFTR